MRNPRLMCLARIADARALSASLCHQNSLAHGWVCSSLPAMKRPLRALSLALTLIVIPGYAHADDATPQERARGLFDSGKTAREAKDFATALRFFRESHEASPSESFDALVNMADCEVALGQTVAAYLHYGEYLRKVQGNDTRAQEVTNTMSVMKNAGPWIRVIRRDLLETNTDFRIDGIPLGSITGKAEDIPAQPGDHSILIVEPTKGERKITVHVEAGKRAVVDFRPQVPPNGGNHPQVVDPQLPKPLPHWVLPAGIVITSGGALGSIAAGAVFATAPRSGVGEAEAKQLTNTTVGLFAAGGVFTAAAVVLAVVNRSKQRETAFAPLVLPGGGGLSVMRRF